MEFFKKVSVIIPVYNSEKYLSECLKSVVDQTYSNLEIIIINDGSTDNSLEIIKQFARKDKRIKVVNKNNEGVSVARNIGIKSSTGDFITFVDSDDWIESSMIDLTVKEAIKTNADIVIWSCFKNYSNREIKISLFPNGNHLLKKDKAKLYLKSIYQFYGMSKLSDTVSAGTTWGKLYKRDLIIKNKIKFKKELVRSQDVIFSMEAFAKADMIMYMDNSLYHYRINDSSVSSGNRYIKNTLPPFNSLLDEMIEFSGYMECHEFYMVFNARIVQVILWHLNHNFFHPNNNLNLREKRVEVKKLINSEPYKTALKNVNYKLLPKKERLMAKLLRRNLVLTFALIDKLHNRYLLMKSAKYK